MRSSCRVLILCPRFSRDGGRPVLEYPGCHDDAAEAEEHGHGEDRGIPEDSG
jgi:hypothetical protein